MSKQSYVPFWGSRIFWIALAVLAAFTAMIISGQLELDGAATTAIPPELVAAATAFARSMPSQGEDALDDGAAEDKETGQEAYRRINKEKEGDRS